MFKKFWRAFCGFIEDYAEAMRIVEMQRYENTINTYNKKIEKLNKK